MAFYLSPQVDVIETDLTTVVPAVSTNITAMVGRFSRGPVNTRTLITNDRELVDIFGEPDSDTYLDWFSAFNFLQYGNSLYITRVINEDGIQTSLNGVHTNSVSTLTVASTGDYPVNGRLTIVHSTGREIVSYAGKTSTSFNNVTRGLAGTSAVAYTGGETVVLAAENSSVAIANTAAPFVAGTAATGSITFSTPSVLSHGDTVTIGDGISTVVFATAKTRENTTFTADDGTDVLTLATELALANGDLVNLTSAGTLPAGTADTTNYFVRIATPTTLTLHTTRADANNNVSAVDITDTGTGVHTIRSARAAAITTPNAIPVDISADATSSTVDDVGQPYQLMLDDLYAIDVVTSAPFVNCPFSATSGILGTETTIADADTYFPGSAISTSDGDTGIVRHISGNRLYVQVLSGTFNLAEGVDNTATFSTMATQVIVSQKVLDIAVTYSDPTVTLTNNNSSSGAALGNIPIVVNAAVSGSYTIVGMAGGVDPKNSRGDYITRYSNEVEPLSTITFAENEVLKVYAKSPGAWGTDLSVSVTNPEDFDNAIAFRVGNQVATFAGEIDEAPNSGRREVALLVIETDPLGNRRVVEKYTASLRQDAKSEDGLTNYIENVINNGSTRINVEVNPVTSGMDLTVVNLTSPLSNSATTATVTTTVGFPSAGRFRLDDEIVSYTGITATTFTGLVRGENGTTPAEHATDSELSEYNTVGTLTDGALMGGADAIINRASIRDEIVAGYDLYSDPEDIDVNIFIDGGNADDTTIQQHLIDNLAESRRDCIAVLSVPWRSVNFPTTTQQISGMNAYRSTPGDPNSLNRSSSYAALYGNWKRQYDRFNDTFRWVPTAGDAAGIMAFTDATRDPWWAPAGLTRGRIRNVIQFRVQPNKAHRDSLYKNQINPLVDFRSDGPVAWGQKTLLNRPSAFDRINVRRMFLVVEKAIATASRAFLFEFNNVFTRKRMLSVIEPFLREVQGRQGLTDFFVKIDDQNNPPSVVQRNELHGDIYIKPTFVAEFIRLNFIATPLGSNFQELVKQN
jgi:hypothetical protein